jgi:hypothetical protein
MFINMINILVVCIALSLRYVPKEKPSFLELQDYGNTLTYYVLW